jgi:hypothetical protein
MPQSQKARVVSLHKLASTYGAASHGKRREIALEYLFELSELLTEMHGNEKILAPMLDIIPYLADPGGAVFFEERRTGGDVPSDAMMACVSACIDVLIEQGHLPEKAAQTIARQIMREGAALPSDGNDARAWKRLLFWRERLMSLKKPARAWPQFQEFKAALLTMPRREMLNTLTDGAIWNQRKPR